MDDFFNDFFTGGAQLPEPTPEDVRMEAMTATELHIDAFNEAVEKRDKSYVEMLPIWHEELQYYLPILEDYEEYEQCKKVFDTMKVILTEETNIELNEQLDNLKVDVVRENDDITEEDEPDF